MQICVLSSSCLTISASSVSHNSLKTTIPLHFPFTSVMFSHFYIPGHLSCILTSFCFPKLFLQCRVPRCPSSFLCFFCSAAREESLCSGVSSRGCAEWTARECLAAWLLPKQVRSDCISSHLSLMAASITSVLHPAVDSHQPFRSLMS